MTEPRCIGQGSGRKRLQVGHVERRDAPRQSACGTRSARPYRSHGSPALDFRALFAGVHRRSRDGPHRW